MRHLLAALAVSLLAIPTPNAASKSLLTTERRAQVADWIGAGVSFPVRFTVRGRLLPARSGHAEVEIH
jgi:hypothetical protein